VALCPWLGEKCFFEGGQLESVADGKMDEVGVGGVLVVGFRRICGTQVICEKTVDWPCQKAGKGMLGIFPSGGIAGAETDTQESEFHDSGGVKFRLGLELNACHLMLGMGGPAAGEQKIDIE
jgi:hypothetical protein